MYNCRHASDTTALYRLNKEVAFSWHDDRRVCLPIAHVRLAMDRKVSVDSDFVFGTEHRRRHNSSGKQKYYFKFVWRGLGGLSAFLASALRVSRVFRQVSTPCQALELWVFCEDREISHGSDMRQHNLRFILHSVVCLLFAKRCWMPKNLAKQMSRAKNAFIRFC